MIRACVVMTACAGLLVACDATTQDMGANEMRFSPPAKPGPTQIASRLSPQDVAQAFRDAGYSSVAVLGGKTIRVRTNTASMIDCGEIIQSARGNIAKFEGTTPTAAILASSRENDILWRSLAAKSELRLDASAGGYAVTETHDITLQYRWASDNEGWTSQSRFTEAAGATLEDNTTCASAGVANSVL